MKNIYDYDNNIQVIKTPSNDVVISMNEAIFTALLNHLYDAAEYQKSHNHTATAEDTRKLREALAIKARA